LGFTFEYPVTVVGRRKPLDKPEHQLVTLVVIATKLLFPFDDIQRHPKSAQEPTVQAIDWDSWAEVQNHFGRRDASAGRIGKGKEILVNEEDVLTMTPDQLDEYMDWYETSWLDHSKSMSCPSFVMSTSSNWYRYEPFGPFIPSRLSIQGKSTG
jgi:RNA polymerase I-specific transcription initiation factor RRN7